MKDWDRVVKKFNGDYWLAHALRVIKSTYGDEVSDLDKNKDLLKFGANQSVGSANYSTIMEFKTGSGLISELYATGNSIDRVVTDDNNNNQRVGIEGHTVSGSGSNAQFTFVEQEATLNGTTPVTLGTPLARMTRLYNNSNTELEADSTVYGYESSSNVTAGVPDTANTIKCLIRETNESNTSLKGSTTISNNDYCLITQVYFSVDKKTNASADFALQVRRPGKVFRKVFQFSLNNQSKPFDVVPLRPYIIVPKNSDVRLVAKASANNVECSGGFNSILCKVETD